MIDIQDLEHHFRSKFSNNGQTNDLIEETKQSVENSYREIMRKPPNTNFWLSEQAVRMHIKNLKSGCAAGIDGIQAEHLKFAIHTDLMFHPCDLLSICVAYGVVPDTFCKGILVPILKKPSVDPKTARNYRPITISVMFSKVLEKLVLNECDYSIMTSSQYGFLPHRSTNMAISVAHDVGAYCLAQGSSTFICSLDTEGAFDAIPHSILLHKAMDAMPDSYWSLFCYWYSHMKVRIRFNDSISTVIPVQKGTRQGGLSSPYLFNLLYVDMINKLNAENCGITINRTNYNVFCYADDILLCSTTASGLQHLISVATDYIVKHGLNFNPSKTICMIIGKNPLKDIPYWSINGEQMTVESNMKYLEAMFDTKISGNTHVETQISAAQRAFFTLQNAGLCYQGVRPAVAIEIYKTAVRSVLQYGCESVHLTAGGMKALDRAQAKFIKSFLGLPKQVHSTKLPKALMVAPITDSVNMASLDLLTKCILSDTQARSFYLDIMNSGKPTEVQKTLLGRAKQFAAQSEISLFQYIYNDAYRNQIKLKSSRSLKIPAGQDGYLDSIRFLLQSYNCKNKEILYNMLKVF